MIDVYKELVANQFEAAFCTLNMCIDRCPGAHWQTFVAKYKFCQVAFHTLFFADLYLGRNVQAFRGQTFHRDNESIFADYEELEDRAPQQVYDKPFIKAYLQHCRAKAARIIASESLEE